MGRRLLPSHLLHCPVLLQNSLGTENGESPRTLLVNQFWKGTRQREWGDHRGDRVMGLEEHSCCLLLPTFSALWHFFKAYQAMKILGVDKELLYSHFHSFPSQFWRWVGQQREEGDVRGGDRSWGGCRVHTKWDAEKFEGICYMKGCSGFSQVCWSAFIVNR